MVIKSTLLWNKKIHLCILVHQNEDLNEHQKVIKNTFTNLNLESTVRSQKIQVVVMYFGTLVNGTGAQFQIFVCLPSFKDGSPDSYIYSVNVTQHFNEWPACGCRSGSSRSSCGPK